MIGYVKLRLFTGWPNPEWTIEDGEARKLANIISDLRVITTEALRRRIGSAIAA